jgi:hypothetical protein
MPVAQRNEYKRQIRKAYVKITASEVHPNPMLKRCSVWGCGNPTQAHKGKGLSQKLCATHVRHQARHGSPHRNSYRAADMKPYLMSTAQWLRTNKGLPFLQRILASYQALLDGAGPCGRDQWASSMHRKSAKVKVKAALARLRERGVSPNRLLIITLSTWSICEDDISMRALPEFRIVQISKQAGRLASRVIPKGSEAKGFDDRANKGYLKFGWQSFPTVSGPILRELGKAIDDIGSHLADQAVPAILTIKRTRFGQHPSRQPASSSNLLVAS